MLVYFAFSLLRAINPRKYTDLADRGYYGEGGKRGRSAITLSVDRIHLFKYIDQVPEKIITQCY